MIHKSNWIKKNLVTFLIGNILTIGLHLNIIKYSRTVQSLPIPCCQNWDILNQLTALKINPGLYRFHQWKLYFHCCIMVFDNIRQLQILDWFWIYGKKFRWIQENRIIIWSKSSLQENYWTRILTLVRS